MKKIKLNRWNSNLQNNLGFLINVSKILEFLKDIYNLIGSLIIITYLIECKVKCDNISLLRLYR